MTYEETTEDWCKRTFEWVDPEQPPARRCARRWVLVGRTELGGTKTFATVLRPASCEALHAEIEREIEATEFRHVTVRASQQGSANPLATKVWVTGREIHSDDGADGELVIGVAPQAAVHITVVEQMKQIRFLLNLLTSTHATTLRHATATEDKLRGENEGLRGRLLEVFETYQDLLDRKHERQVDLLKTQTITSSAEALVQALSFRLFGGGAVPEGAPGEALAKAITEFGKSISPEQMAELQQFLPRVLRPEQLVTIMQLLKSPDEEGTENTEETTVEVTPPQTPKLVSKEVLTKLKRELPPGEYKDKLQLYREAVSVVKDPLGTLLDDSDGEPS